MTATIIADALAAAERETPKHFAPKGEDPSDARATRYVTTIDGGSCLDGKESMLAEAVAWAEDPGGENNDSDGRWCQYPDHVVYVRLDVAEAALKHLAERLERAEEMSQSFWAAVCEARADTLEVNALISESFPDIKPEWAAERRADAAQLRAWAKEAKP